MVDWLAKLGYHTTISEFNSYWVLYTSDFVPKYSKHRKDQQLFRINVNELHICLRKGRI